MLQNHPEFEKIELLLSTTENLLSTTEPGVLSGDWIERKIVISAQENEMKVFSIPITLRITEEISAIEVLRFVAQLDLKSHRIRGNVVQVSYRSHEPSFSEEASSWFRNSKDKIRNVFIEPSPDPFQYPK